MSNGAQQGGLDAFPAVEMAAFDSLPPELRALLNYAPLDYSALALARAKPGGVQQIGGLAIVTPDERGAMAARIYERLGPTAAEPFQAGSGTKVARATLRPLLTGRTFPSRSRARGANYLISLVSALGLEPRTL